MTADTGRPIGKTIEMLYNQRTWLLLLANSYLQNFEAAQDVVNDSFIALLENAGSLEDAVMKSFLATTVKNKCLNYLRRSNCEKIIHHRLKLRAIDAYNISLLEADTMDARLTGNEVMGLCRETLSKLPTQTSKIFMDRLNGLTYKEIAEKYGISQRSVTYEVSKALAVLKVSLKDYLPLIFCLLMMNTR